MATQVGTGSGTGETRAGIEKALSTASAVLGSNKPTLGLLYVGPRHDVRQVTDIANAKYPQIEFIVVATSGFTDTSTPTDTISAMLIATDSMSFKSAFTDDVDRDWKKSVAALTEGFQAASSDAAKKFFPHSSTIMMFTGVSQHVDALAEGVRQATRPFQQIIGGGHIDATGKTGPVPTLASVKGKTVNAGALAVHVFGAQNWAVGAAHGFTPATQKFTVTKSSGNLLQELDKKPAVAVYEDFAKKKGLNFANLDFRFMVENELGVYSLDEVVKVRCPLGVSPKGELICAGPIAEHSKVSIVAAEQPELIRAATDAAKQAREALKGQKAAGILLFSCVCRGMLLGDEYGKEIAAVRAVFPNTPLLGMLSAGEIARYKGSLDGVHNATAVVAAIPAA